MKFEWDPAKAAINAQKHHITFEEAESVFLDADALCIPDPDHSAEEQRFILLGFSRKARMLVVCHCFRGNDSTIRIISARKATRREAGQYGGER